VVSLLRFSPRFDLELAQNLPVVGRALVRLFLAITDSDWFSYLFACIQVKRGDGQTDRENSSFLLMEVAMGSEQARPCLLPKSLNE
jgi:hypothetical protein